jgi:hypothetical protein
MIHTLLIEGVERSIAWIINLKNWMDGAHENAHCGSRMSKAKARSLLTQLVCHVFAKMLVVRMGVVNSTPSGSVQSLVQTLWNSS